MNAEASMTNREQRIRDIAYFLWLEAGCPEGDAEKHWFSAERFVDSEPADDESVEESSSVAAKEETLIDEP
jgi:hypothetical protein